MLPTTMKKSDMCQSDAAVTLSHVHFIRNFYCDIYLTHVTKFFSS